LNTALINLSNLI